MPSERQEDYCRTLMPLLPAYSLGMATLEENRTVEKLLPFCPEAQTALRDYQGIRDTLLTIVPLDESPPPFEALLQRLPAHAPKQTSTPIYTHTPLYSANGYPTHEPPKAQTHLLPPPVLLPAAPKQRRIWQGLAVACLILAFVTTNLFWAAQLDGLRREQQAFLQTLSARDPVSTFNASNQHRPLLPAEAEAQNTEASFVWNSTDQIGALVVDGLPALDDGETYQLWLVREDHSLSLGTFQVDPDGVGVLVFEAAEMIEDFDHIGVNIEPLGGTTMPTTPHLIIGDV